MSESSAPIQLRDVATAEARELSAALADAVGVEVVSAETAHGRILAQHVDAPNDFPRFSNSEMDGWAVRCGTEEADGWQIIGESRAGRPFADSLPAGAAVRISTGAELPIGADAVLPLEVGFEEDGQVRPARAAAPGDHIRAAGRHVSAGDRLIAAGTRLGAGELAAVAAFGIDLVAVRARPRVALICGGDELLSPGEPLVAGAVYDSNSPMLSALLRGAGCEVARRHYASDDRAAVRALLEASAAEADLIVTCGGISVGDHDHIGPAVEQLGGEIVLSGTNARPGRRFAIATLRDGSRQVPLFCVPGNPLSAWVCFQLYVRRHLREKLGQPLPRVFETELSRSVERDAGREKIALGVTTTAIGARSFTPRLRPSDDVTALSGSNALAIVPPGDSVAHKGLIVECERVDV